MAVLHARYIEASQVILYCPGCGCIVGQIHSTEVLPLMYHLTLEDAGLLCFDCDNRDADEVPDCLKREQGDFIKIGNVIVGFEDSWRVEFVDEVACPVNHNSKNGN